VDVGVDFHINLLVFEASSSAEFLQRFGRLGRHEGYIDRQGRSVTFDPDSYRAYALCPRFICARIAEKLDSATEGTPTAFDQTTPVDRPAFSNDIVRDVFPNRQQFQLYTRRWGLLQAAPYIANLRKPRWRDVPDNYGPLREALAQQFAESFGAHVGAVYGAAKRYRRDREDKIASVLLDEVCSFRGESLGCAIWDTTDDTLKTYNLLFMLANSEFEVLSQTTFMAEVQRRGLSEYEYEHQQFYIRVIRYLEERDRFRFSNKGLHLGKTHQADLNHAVVLSGFRVADLPRPNIGEINTQLEKQRLVCTITTEWGDKPVDLKRRLNLPPLFPIHSLTATGPPACIAFGKAALLLDSLLWYRKNKSDDGAFFDFTPCDDEDEEDSE
jgi:CRISPR-associated endonuclease/helicase Cas3